MWFYEWGNGGLRVINKYRSEDVTCIEGRNQASAHDFRPLLQLSALFVIVPEVNEDQNDRHKIEEHIENEEDYL